MNPTEISRQHAATTAVELHGKALERFVGTPSDRFGCFELLFLRLEGSWYRIFADEGVFFLSTTDTFEALQELSRAGGGTDLCQLLGWRDTPQLTILRYDESELLIKTSVGSVTIVDDHGLWRVGTYNLLSEPLTCPRCGATTIQEIEARLGYRDLQHLAKGDIVKWHPSEAVEKGGRPKNGDTDADGYVVCANCQRDFFVKIRVRSDVIIDLEPDPSRDGYL